MSTISDQEFSERLGHAMVKRSALVIGGNTLSRDDYAQLIHNLIQHARVNFKTEIIANEGLFRKALLDESNAMQMRLRDTVDRVDDTRFLISEVQSYLENQFGLKVLSKLESIEGDIKKIEHILSTSPILDKTLPKRATVMISSTIRDMAEHRKEVMDACLRQGMFPIMMEHLPASDDQGVSASLKLVDSADIYIGIFAHRYGNVPKGQRISITEMEYNRAVERGIPRLIFIMDENHPTKPTDFEEGAGAVKLHAFKRRLLDSNIVNFFQSPTDLRGDVINSLSQYRPNNVPTFHHTSSIPIPPNAYVAHPYILMQSKELIGRHSELNALNSWVSHIDAEMYRSRVLSIVAVGGMGKSALAWKWFNDMAPLEMQPLAGRMWWSFYESDAGFENFVTRALIYSSGRSEEAIQQLTQAEREQELLGFLDNQPFLIVLDGLERILIAYARADTAALPDDMIDKKTANILMETKLSTIAFESFQNESRLRFTADPRAGPFLRKLVRTRSSRILITSRLYPADLQAPSGQPIPGCLLISLKGLSQDAALSLWQTLGVSGSREELLPLFNSFDDHPLLIQTLASQIATYRRAPGNFHQWRKRHPDFNPFLIPLVQRKSHVLAFALRGLRNRYLKVLQTVTGFRMPTTYELLSSILVGMDKGPNGNEKPFETEEEFDRALSELECVFR